MVGQSKEPVEPVAHVGEPIYMRPLDDEGQAWEFYWTEEEVDEAITDEDIQEALALAGAWSDLDADEVLAELDRIRHANPPTPLLELDFDE
jgi:hypothetical protein